MIDTLFMLEYCFDCTVDCTVDVQSLYVWGSWCKFNLCQGDPELHNHIRSGKYGIN